MEQYVIEFTKSGHAFSLTGAKLRDPRSAGIPARMDSHIAVRMTALRI